MSADLIWRKSSFSGGGNGECVEVATEPARLVHLRDSNRPGVTFTTLPLAWAPFVAAVKSSSLVAR
ncbi:DUF397 domain-containing protein [Streptomyces caatingaensis]|uniref:DUF397 domain-containing protein n=1 Tax=Streptomyces caatingaensis TaxID=1678637 RepID=UPI00099D11BF|nr:DUF397 domain-containing protein [Streptomyces caatingaensis]